MAYQMTQQNMFNPYEISDSGIEPAKKRSWLGKTILGEREQFQRNPTQTPQGMDYLNQLLASAGQNLQNPQAGFQPFADRATNQFNTEIIPEIANRFTNSGGQRSGAFQAALGNAGSDLASRLAQMSSEYGLKNREQSLNEGRVGLTSQFENLHRPATQGILQSVLMSILSGKGLSDVGKTYGQQYGQFGGEKNFGQQGQQSGDVSQLISKLLPLLV